MNDFYFITAGMERDMEKNSILDGVGMDLTE